MSVTSNRQFSRRPSVGKPLSGAVGLLLSVCLVTALTIWATSSPFSPLSPKPEVESAYDPVPMLQKVKDAFTLSESVLRSPSLEPVASQFQSETSTVLAQTISDDSDLAALAELTQLEKSHKLQQEDRSAWLSFSRQDSLSATKPVVRSDLQSLREVLASNVNELPEVHFASADPHPKPLLTDQPALEEIPRLPTQESVVGKSPVKETRPTRVATLPEHRRYVAPNGKNNTSALELAPSLPPRKSWETGQY